jgi:outer membrane autotransporter protein
VQRLDTTLGIAASSQFFAAGGTVRPSLSFGWQYPLADETLPPWLRFEADRQSVYRIGGLVTAAATANVGTGLSYRPNHSTELFARYSAAIASNSEVQVASAGLKLRW